MENNTEASDANKKQKLFHEGEKPAHRSRAPKGYWTAAEDQMLIAAVDAQKIRSRISWKEISKEITGRSEKQCRERYMDYLNPSIDHSDWETFEDEIILKGQRELGNRWKDICKLITHKNRGAASVKVRWHFLQRKVDTKKRHDMNTQPKMFFIVNPAMQGNTNVGFQPGADASGQPYPMLMGMPGGMTSPAAQYANMLGLPEGSIPPGAVVYICPPDASGLPQVPGGGIDFGAIAAAANNSQHQQLIQQHQQQQQQHQQQQHQQQQHLQQQAQVQQQLGQSGLSMEVEMLAKAYL